MFSIFTGLSSCFCSHVLLKILKHLKKVRDFMEKNDLLVNSLRNDGVGKIREKILYNTKTGDQRLGYMGRGLGWDAMYPPFHIQILV